MRISLKRPSEYRCISACVPGQVGEHLRGRHGHVQEAWCEELRYVACEFWHQSWRRISMTDTASAIAHDRVTYRVILLGTGQCIRQRHIPSHATCRQSTRRQSARCQGTTRKSTTRQSTHGQSTSCETNRQSTSFLRRTDTGFLIG
jgi:hypothetical protein